MWLLLACADPTRPSDTADPDISPDSTGYAGTLPCLNPEINAVLSAFLANLDVIARLSPAQATSSKAIAFYQLPGVDVSRALEFNLSQPCTVPADLDPSCVTDACFWTECTGVGGSWIEHAEDVGAGAAVTDVEGWAVDRGRIEIAWSEGAPRFDVRFDVRGLTGTDGFDYAFEGTAVMDGLLDLALVFPRLYNNGEMTLSLTDSETGGINVAGWDIAEWNGTSFRDASCEE